MKITMTVDIEVSPKEWNAAIGSGSSPMKADKVDADVRSYVENSLIGLALIEESGATITIR